MTRVHPPHRFLKENICWRRGASVRCMHLDRRGWQCSAEALEGSAFCAVHRPFIDAVETEPKSGRPLLYRLAAFALLLIFLFNAYQTVRARLGC